MESCWEVLSRGAGELILTFIWIEEWNQKITGGLISVIYAGDNWFGLEYC